MRHVPAPHRSFLVLLACLAAPLAAQQPRPVTHDDYDQWPSIRSTAYSPDGKWIAYSVDPAVGDGVLFVRQVDGDKVHRYPRGGSPRFSADGKKVIFSVRKSVAEEYQKKLARLFGAGSKELEAESRKAAAEAEREAERRRAEMVARFTRGRRGGRPGGSTGATSGSGKLAILDVATGKVEVIDKTRSFRVLDKGAILVYHLPAPEPPPQAAAGEAKTSPARQSKTPATGKPKTPATGKPKAPATGKPKAPATGKPKAPATGKSEAPATGQAAGRPGPGARGQRGGEGRRGTGGRPGGRGRRSEGATGPGRSRGAGGRSSAGRSAPAGGRPTASSSGTRLVLRNLASGRQTTYEGVARFQPVADDRWLLLTLAAPTGAAARPTAPTGAAARPTAPTGAAARPTAPTGAAARPTAVTSGLVAVRLADGKQIRLIDGAASFSGFTTDRHHKKLAFTSDIAEKRAEAAAKAKAAAAKAKAAAAEAKAAAATEKTAAARKSPPAAAGRPATGGAAKPAAAPPRKPARSEIFLWEFDDRAPRKLVDARTKGVPRDFTVQSSGLSFSADGTVLTFGIQGKPRPELPKILPEEKVEVDIWHWNDGSVQSMQARRRGGSPAVLTCALHLDEDRVVVLGDEAIPSVRLLTIDGSRALATDGKPYEKLVTWDGRYSDVYVVNTVNGERTRILSRLRSRPQASPSGRYVLYFGEDNQWYAIDIETNAQTCLTKGLDVAFHNELEDRPQPASAYGIAGWTKGDKEVLLYDRYDIWKVDLGSGAVACVTDGYGRANQIELRVSGFDIEGDDERRDPDERPYLQDTLVLSAKHDVTKARGYYTDTLQGLARPRKWIMLARSIGGLTRAQQADRLFFTLSTFAQFPDIWVSDLEFRNRRQVTDACAIQKQVRWGRSETVTWINDDGVRLQGILIKPDGFDPNRQYPMMVYFYERNSDNVHRYVQPAPGTSPNAAYYVSNGYLWFVPDIVYTVGYPGESAEKCVISGVQHLIAQGFVDRKAIGIAGHSWGGYQTAHLVTRSNLFAAAESGAPVSNMFSAYGGIRYQTGMSRQFQYERTQSRIGGTPWQYPQRYWQSSPLFYADRVQTPVLILHNDNDGAVPWTNGLEFFMALRRLGKEAYLFNYNGEPHGLRKPQNTKDWTRRMAEFFDHHLRGRPAPRWMTDGVKYEDREREKIQYAPSFLERQRRARAATTSGANQGADPGNR